MRRWAWSLLTAAGMVLIAGIVHVGLAFSEHVRHPEWSAPAYVTIIYLVPYVLVTAALAGLYLWLTRRAGAAEMRPTPPPRIELVRHGRSS